MKSIVESTKAPPLLITIADHRTLFDFLSDLPPLQSKHHIAGTFKEPFALHPAHTAFAMLQSNKLLFHFTSAVWADLVAVSLLLGSG